MTAGRTVNTQGSSGEAPERNKGHVMDPCHKAAKDLAGLCSWCLV